MLIHTVQGACGDVSRSGRSRAALVALVLLGTLTASRPASATPSFPDVIQAELGLATAPDCTLCHRGAPRRGTVTTPFGRSARDRGLVADDDGSLRTALRRLEGERVDSDGDGTPDIEELRAGGDPNLLPDGSSPTDELTPTYGCGAQIAPTSVGGIRALPALLLVIAAACARVHRRRSPRPTTQPPR
jgi:hypothetical protein